MLTYIKMTGLELRRKKVFLMACILSLLFLILYTYGLHNLQSNQTPADTESLISHYVQGLGMIYIGLFFAQFIIAFYVLFSSMATISGEIESGLLYVILARPNPRWKIYLWKWIGYSFWNVLYAGIIYVCIIGAGHWQLGFPIRFMPLCKGFLLFELTPLILLALSMLGSTYLPSIGNGIATALLFGLGTFSGLVNGVANSHTVHPGIEKFNLITSLLIPTDSLFHRMLFEMMGNIPFGQEMSNFLGPFFSKAVPSNAFIIYAVCYLALLLLWGCIHFTQKDI